MFWLVGIFLGIKTTILWWIYKEIAMFGKDSRIHNAELLQNIKSIEKNIDELDEILVPPERRMRR